VLGEARRVLRPGGLLHLRTVNRYSVLGEPHVGLWGIGFLPRPVAVAYVRWRGRGDYSHHHPWSVGQLVRAMRQSGFVGVTVAAARPLASEVRRMPEGLRRFADGYDRIHRWPGVRLVAPVLEARGSIA
jgi:SAM-dependent methyltransferase